MDETLKVNIGHKVKQFIHERGIEISHRLSEDVTELVFNQLQLYTTMQTQPITETSHPLCSLCGKRHLAGTTCNPTGCDLILTTLKDSNAVVDVVIMKNREKSDD